MSRNAPFFDSPTEPRLRQIGEQNKDLIHEKAMELLSIRCFTTDYPFPPYIS